MNSIGYYFYDDGYEGRESNRASDQRPISVNCAGEFFTESPFVTDNREGRLDYYLLYLISGRLTVYTEASEIECEGGDFVIFPPKTHYKYSHSDGTPLHYVWIHFTGRDAQEILREYKLPLYPCVSAVGDARDVAPRIQTFITACAEQSLYKEAELSILFNRLLLSIARSVSGESKRLLKKSVSYINSYYNTEIKIPSLAKMENLSVSRYNALFREVMGVSPLEYIIRIRCAFASELLRQTSLSVKEISSTVGYADAHFFSRIFKRCVGESPISYRKKHGSIS